jgi:TonB family protein
VSAKASLWDLPEGVVLPVISGEIHPLKRSARRLLIRGITVAGVLHLGAFGGWLIARSIKPEPESVQAIELNIKTVKSAQDLGVPPSLSRDVDAAQAVMAEAAAVATIGVPEPVPDFQAVTSTMATMEQIADALQPVDVSDLGSNADSIVVDPSLFDMDSDGPVSINAVEELPVPINTPAPEYPDMARESGVEGIVRFRALITKEGRVSEVKIVEGNMLLEDAAISAVRRWTFKPALQQHRPVAVWVESQLDFTLGN